MRVLFVSGEYPPMQGGVGDYAWSLGTALSSLGVDVHVLTSQAAGPAHLAPAGVANIYPDVEHWGWGFAGQVKQLAQELEADYVHVQYQAAAYGLHPAVNLLPRSLRRCPWPRRVAVTFHDLRVPYLFPKAGPLRWRANLALAQDSDLVMVTNAEDCQRMGDYEALRTKLVEIPIGANISPEPPPGFSRKQQRRKWGVDSDGLLLAYFGFLNESKGAEELVQALSLLSQDGLPVQLLMVGGQVGASDPTNRAYLQRVQDLIAELGLEDQVHWTGFTAASEVSANLLAADLAVLPYRDGASFRRGSLMAVLAHGLPVISTRPAVLIPELVDGVNISLVPARSARGLATAIRTLEQDPEQRRQLAEAASALARRFTWDAIAQQHVKIYAEFL